MIRATILIIFISAILYGCGDGQNPKIDPKVDGVDTNRIEKEEAQKIVKSFASPVETAAMIKNENVPFNKDLLCPTDDADKYTTDFKKALGLGFLSADLGYLNIYEQTSSIVSYITLIKRLAEGIKVGQFFDFSTLKKLATTGDNLDSLMYLSVNSFNQMDEHLRENNRSNLSLLIITGVWVEGLWLATQVVQEIPNDTVITQNIGEQKKILKDILYIFERFSSKKEYAQLIADLEKIEAELNKVEITITEVEGQVKEVETDDGGITYVQLTTSHAKITPEILKNITKVTKEVRTKLINL